MTLDEAKAEGFAAGIAGTLSHLAPIGIYERAWLSAWMDGRVGSRKAPGAPASWPVPAQAKLMTTERYDVPMEDLDDAARIVLVKINEALAIMAERMHHPGAAAQAAS